MAPASQWASAHNANQPPSACCASLRGARLPTRLHPQTLPPRFRFISVSHGLPYRFQRPYRHELHSDTTPARRHRLLHTVPIQAPQRSPTTTLRSRRRLLVAFTLCYAFAPVNAFVRSSLRRFPTLCYTARACAPRLLWDRRNTGSHRLRCSFLFRCRLPASTLRGSLSSGPEYSRTMWDYAEYRVVFLADGADALCRHNQHCVAAFPRASLHPSVPASGAAIRPCPSCGRLAALVAYGLLAPPPPIHSPFESDLCRRHPIYATRICP